MKALETRSRRRRQPFACLVAVGLLGVASIGCGGDAATEMDGEADCPSTTGGEARPKPIRQVEKVLIAQRPRLFSCYDAEGLGISSTIPGTPRDPKEPVHLIVVDLKDEEDRPDGEHAIDGVPIRFVVSGEIRPD